MSNLDARFVAMTLWMKMKMMNENMMEYMKSEDEWEYEWKDNGK